jgi:hypothetical protein
MAAKKAKLGLQLPAADYNLIRSWADKNGMNISEYARKVLMASVPTPEKKRVPDPTKRSIVDAAYEEIEKQDAFDTGTIGNLMSLPPIRQPQIGVAAEADRTHPLQRVTKTTRTQLPTVPPGPHPCAHLTSKIPSNMRGQCQGSCNHTQQPGRVCYWTPTTARSCPLFEAKGAGRGLQPGHR